MLNRGASTVTLLARDKGKLKEAVSALEGEFPDRKIRSISADVSAPTVKTVLEEECKSNPVDVLVNCAGVTTTAPLEEIPQSKVEEVININLIGSIYVTQALLPSFKKKNGGAIVFISSQAGQLGLYGYTVYSSTKYALRGLAECLQMEVMPYGISVSISFPPDTETPQLVGERLQRSDIVNQLTSFGTVFQPERIVTEVWDGVERKQFQISHGFDGVLLATGCCGMSPVTSIWDCIVQVFGAGLCRLVGLLYLAKFNSIVERGLKVVKKQL